MTFELEQWLASKARNPVLDRLARRLPVTAFGVRGARTAEIARIARAAGNDAIWIDLEHSTMSIDTAAQICAAALDIGLVPLARVPEKDYGVIGRLLDGGALGIIAPRIETAQQAAEIAAACRFPPRGQRSAIATLPHLELRRVPAARLNETLNQASIVKVLIETPLGLQNLDAIASLPEVDLIGIGVNDLTAELGVPGEAAHPEVRAALERAIQVCQRLRKPLAIGGIADAAYAAELIELGAAPFFFTGIDTDVLLAAAQEPVRLALASYNRQLSS